MLGAAQPGATRAAALEVSLNPNPNPSPNLNPNPNPNALEVALNGQNFGASGFAFTRYVPPPRGVALLQLQPVSGPSLGGTVLEVRPAAGLPGGTEYVCRFGAVRSPASLGGEATALQLRCAAPPAESGAVPVWLTLNGQQFSPLGLPGETFQYVAAAVVSAVSPSAGPREGDTRVVVSGAWDFAAAAPDERLRCRFGETTVRATRGVGSTLVCIAPAVPRGAARLAAPEPPTLRQATLTE